MNEVERIILENTDKRYTYIARDRIGNLYLYKIKPKKGLREWEDYKYEYLEFMGYNHLFQDIKWEDEEPYKFR